MSHCMCGVNENLRKMRICMHEVNEVNEKCDEGEICVWEMSLATVPSPIHFKIAWTEYLMHRSEQSLYSTLQHPITNYLHPLKPAD